MEREYCGKIIRYLMQDHNKNRATPKSELVSLLALKSTDINKILFGAKEYLKIFDLDIISANENLALEKAEKVFLVKRKSSNNKQRKTDDIDFIENNTTGIMHCSIDKGIKKLKLSQSENIIINSRHLFFILSAIQVENNQLDESKLEILNCARIFEDVSVFEFIKKFKSMGYLKSTKANDSTIYMFGWRYYAEFGNRFDIISYYKNKIAVIV